MRVYVVASDCGLNGLVIHGVRSTPELARKLQVGSDFFSRGETGYQYTGRLAL